VNPHCWLLDADKRDLADGFEIIITRIFLDPSLSDGIQIEVCCEYATVASALFCSSIDEFVLSNSKI